MSATDWYVCNLCKKKAIDYIDSWYGKVTKEEWDALLTYRKAWEDEDSDWKSVQKIENIIDKIEERFEDFERDNFSIDESVYTVRYDSDTGFGSGVILDMTETYECQHCDFRIEVNKKWKQGINQEHK